MENEIEKLRNRASCRRSKSSLSVINKTKKSNIVADTLVLTRDDLIESFEKSPIEKIDLRSFKLSTIQILNFEIIMFVDFYENKTIIFKNRFGHKGNVL